MPFQTKILFVSDIHGSETVFRKSLNAAKMYKANYLIFGGDLFSKDFVPVIMEGSSRLSLEGNEVDVNQLMEIGKKSGKIPLVMTKEEYHEAISNKKYMLSLVERELEKQASQWVKIFHEKMDGSGIEVFWNTGNDDPLGIDDTLSSFGIEIIEGKVKQIEDLNLVSSGYVNPTPYNSYREIPDSTLFLKLDSMMRQVKEGDIILNAHAPPIDTKLDMAIGKDRKRYHVGSKAVRDIIETYKPIVGLHGHIHESGGTDKLGNTRIGNPGSFYIDGILSAIYLVLEREVKGKGAIVSKTYKVKTMDIIRG
jgi:Icc-related predicted phosphoesterase